MIIVAWRYRKPIVDNAGVLVEYSDWILSETKDFLEQWPHEALVVLKKA